MQVIGENTQPDSTRPSGWRNLPKRIGNGLALVLAALAPIFAVLTYFLLSGDPEYYPYVNMVLVADFCIVIGLLALIAWRVALLILARRAKSAGSRLHLRLVRLFILVTVAPALLLGLFAALTVTFNLDGWFNKQISAMVSNSAHLAQRYADEKRYAITTDARLLADEVSKAVLTQGADTRQVALLLEEFGSRSGIDELLVIDGMGNVIANNPSSFLLQFEPPPPSVLKKVQKDGVYVYSAPSRDEEIRVAARLPGFSGQTYYLHLSRMIDPEAAKAIVATRRAVSRYEAFVDDRERMQFLFAGFYIGFACLVLSAAIWFGIWFADRLVKPIGVLASAAGRVSQGEQNVKVPEGAGGDEIALLSRTFNRMTDDIASRRNELLEMNAHLEERSRFIEAVLSGADVGVVGIDHQETVTVINAHAALLLGCHEQKVIGREISAVVPELAEALDQARSSNDGRSERRQSIIRMGQERDLLARVTRQGGKDGFGYVITLDDMTELASAQRMAAWADVARRVAHEIRNPLTPIQLSTERLKRKFGDTLKDEKKVFERCTETIIRQVEDIRRMVDTFSKFARMPEPVFQPENMTELMREVVALRAPACPQVLFETIGAESIVQCDRGMMTQVLTNLVKNAEESVINRLAQQREAGEIADPGLVTLELSIKDETIRISVEDNGLGLPQGNSQKLLEPYVTTRSRGSGLGLAISRKIAEQHHGTLMLENRSDGQGARAVLSFPAQKRAPSHAGEKSSGRGASARLSVVNG